MCLLYYTVKNSSPGQVTCPCLHIRDGKLKHLPSIPMLTQPWLTSSGQVFCCWPCHRPPVTVVCRAQHISGVRITSSCFQDMVSVTSDLQSVSKPTYSNTCEIMFNSVRARKQFNINSHHITSEKTLEISLEARFPVHIPVPHCNSYLGSSVS